jgi:nucleoside-diphosphate-sugar epimerase
LSVRTALIAGASGLIGRRIADHLLALGDWNVIGLARKPPPDADIRFIAVDLANAEDCRRKLGELDEITHVFYAARFDHPEEGKPEPLDTNAAMLRNLVDVLKRAPALEHVHAVHGSKYYGHQLGPVPVPLREDSPRAPNQNFYFTQEDDLAASTRNASWHYSTSRPHAFCDPAIDRPRSAGLVFAVYAAIQRELGLRFDFPGGAAGFEAHTQFTDLALLARAVTWMATEPRCANQSFNVVNGDYPRWCELWTLFASELDVELGVPRKFSLATYMADKAAVWDRIVAKHGLRKTRLDTLVLWPYGDYQLRPDWEVMSSMAKARALGFHETVDSHEMFKRQFENYRAHDIIPPAAAR